MRGWTAGALHTTMVNTILCYAEDPHGNRVEVSVMPDSGSQQNIAHEKQLCGLKLTTVNLGQKGPNVQGVECSKPIHLKKLSQLMLVSKLDSSKSLEVPVFLIDQPGQWFAKIPKQTPKWLARKENLADPRIVKGHSSIPIHVILNADIFNKLIEDRVEYRRGGLVLRRTIFGQVVSGKYLPDCPDWAYETGATFPAFSILSSDPEYLTMLGDGHVAQKVEWHHAIDAFDIYGKPYVSDIEQDKSASEFLELYMSTLTRLEDGGLEAPLIVNPNFRGKLSTNDHLAAPRHARNLQVIKEKTSHSEGYKRAMDEIISICCEEISDDAFKNLKASGRNWCKLPIHPVVRLDSPSTPYRQVMDASACEKGCQPLNKYLLSGPNIMPVIQNILRRFQITPCVLIADIKKAFLQIQIGEQDRDLLLVEWWKEGSDGTYESKLYRFHRLPWGLISAPFILNAVVRFLYKEYAKQHPETQEDVDDLCQTTYVDDILAFRKTKEEVQRKMRIAVAALSLGKMLAFKFRSHPKSAADELIQEIEPGAKPSSEEFKVLGLWYNTTTDELWSEHIHDFDTKHVLRKRHIAGIVARIFDPFGLLSPMTMMSKLMWQEYLLKHPKSSWDTEVPNSERKLWESQIDEAEKLQVLRFP